jgi:hypothetical protein
MNYRKTVITKFAVLNFSIAGLNSVIKTKSSLFLSIKYLRFSEICLSVKPNTGLGSLTPGAYKELTLDKSKQIAVLSCSFDF